MMILAIDDDIEDLEFFQEVICCIDSSIQCIPMYDCSKALIFLQDTLPDIVFIDINMPKMTGIECLSEIIQIKHLEKLPVVLFSTALNPKFSDLLIRPNAKFVSKESSLKESIATIKSVLNQFNLLSVSQH